MKDSFFAISFSRGFGFLDSSIYDDFFGMKVALIFLNEYNVSISTRSTKAKDISKDAQIQTTNDQTYSDNIDLASLDWNNKILESFEIDCTYLKIKNKKYQNFRIGVENFKTLILNVKDLFIKKILIKFSKS